MLNQPSVITSLDPMINNAINGLAFVVTGATVAKIIDVALRNYGPRNSPPTTSSSTGNKDYYIEKFAIAGGIFAVSFLAAYKFSCISVANSLSNVSTNFLNVPAKIMFAVGSTLSFVQQMGGDLAGRVTLSLGAAIPAYMVAS